MDTVFASTLRWLYGRPESKHQMGRRWGKESVIDTSRNLSEILLLPVEKWFVAKEPLPLSIDGVVDSSICEHRTGRIVSVVASHSAVISPIAIFSTCCLSVSSYSKHSSKASNLLTTREINLFKPLGITIQGPAEANSVGAGKSFGSIHSIL